MDDWQARLSEQLQQAADLDRAISSAVTDTTTAVPGFEVNSVQIALPGRLRLLENLFIARRTHSALSRLMLRTADPSTTEDFTEPAAVLGRHLVELLLQCAWLTRFEPPPGSNFPAPLGDGDRLRSIANADWPDEEIAQFTGYLCNSTSWIDVQALRSELHEINQQRLLNESSAEWDKAEAKLHRSNLEFIADRTAMTKARLREIGVPTTKREGYVDIAKKMGHGYLLMYRMESDPAHAGEIGRQHQRGQEREPALGAPSSPIRRAYVMSISNAALLEIADQAISELGGDRGALKELWRVHQDSLPPDPGEA